MEIQIPDIEHIGDAARQFTDAMQGRTIFAFDGEMGAGKTTFINALCKELGVEDEETGSPTFAIVNEYRDRSRNPIYHFDLYRIECPEEALDFGIEDYFDSGHLCLMEWADHIETLLPPETVTISIRVNPDGSRTLSF